MTQLNYRPPTPISTQGTTARRERIRVTGGRILSGVAALVVLAWPGAGVAQAASATTTFDSPGVHQFTVPPGVRRVTVVAVGAAGGSCGGGQVRGGEGAAVTVTLPVSPDEHLVAGVGAPGAPCGPGSGTGSGGGAGGTGGGGNGGGGNAGTSGGAGGGGASLLGVASPSPAFGGLLVVAGAGGGASCCFVHFSLGGDSGSAAVGNQGGAQGTLTAGGAGGNSGVRGATSDSIGGSGSFGLGGAGAGGGSCFTGRASSGGGGGGGGYYGGGGAGYCEFDTSGSGGGGGSSFISSAATIILPPTLTDAPAGVSITYPAPTADVSAKAISFGSQAPGTAGPEKLLTVTNRGSAPLLISGVLLGGSGPDDFLVNDRCQQPLDAGSRCEIALRFDPQSPGERSATVKLLTNVARPPTLVELTGTGGTASTRVEHRGSRIELATCKQITDAVVRVSGTGPEASPAPEACAGRLVSGAVDFSPGGSSVLAALARHGAVYATGVSVPTADGGYELVLRDRLALTPASYSLTLRHRHARRWVTRRLSVVFR